MLGVYRGRYRYYIIIDICDRAGSGNCRRCAGGVFSRPRFAFSSAAVKRYYNILLLYAETFIITNVDIIIILS